MSSATIDRYLAPFKSRLHPDAKSSTRPQRTGSKTSLAPWPIAGHTVKGEFAFTLTVTDPFTGWTINAAVKNKASKWIVEALDEAKHLFP